MSQYSVVNIVSIIVSVLSIYWGLKVSEKCEVQQHSAAQQASQAQNYFYLHLKG